MWLASGEECLIWLVQVLSWLLEAEDHLLSLHSLGQKQLETVRQRFYNHEDFMLKLRDHQGAVRKVTGGHSQGATESGLSLRFDVWGCFPAIGKAYVTL